MNIAKFFGLCALGVFALTSCTTLPRPVVATAADSTREAMALLDASAARAGDPWARFSEVTVQYDGEWSRLVPKLQPILADTAYRKSSLERYQPQSARVVQQHTGPAGKKVVTRTGRAVTVTRNASPISDAEERAAAALVVDAYTVFTFGSSVLRSKGSSWRISGQRTLDGERCTLVSGLMKPGFGEAASDTVIAWIGTQSKRLLRVQLTLNGLDSTAGADVDVTFSDFRPGPMGTEWPHRFIEYVRRPLNLKAHDWRLTEVTARPK